MVKGKGLWLVSVAAAVECMRISENGVKCLPELRIHRRGCVDLCRRCRRLLLLSEICITLGIINQIGIFKLI